MPLTKLLIANRGEIALRIARAAADLGIRTVAVHASDDLDCLHALRADKTAALLRSGPAAYLDCDALIGVARERACDSVHPGYGFLSESADFARACAAAGFTFVGPAADVLELFGDKGKARALAARVGVPVLRGTMSATSLDDVRKFFLQGGRPIMLKAIAGGGGRGIQPVYRAEDIEAAFERCTAEAKLAFSRGDLYVEELLTGARHIEVQIVGDGARLIHLYDRDCTIQRARQKLIEIAPAPNLPRQTREHLTEASLAMAREAGLHGVATFEFLVSLDSAGKAGLAFVEANPRIQVEHTVTEQVLGIDLVRAQLLIAGGASLAEAGLDPARIPAPRGIAVQVRINAERMNEDGVRPAAGTLTAFDLPGGPGVRVDTHGYTGYTVVPRFDSLLAKLIVHSNSDRLAHAAQRTRRALDEFRVEGIDTNIGLLRAVLDHAEFQTGNGTTTFIEERLPALLAHAASRIVAADPLAVLRVRPASTPRAPANEDIEEPGIEKVRAPMHGTLVTVLVQPDETVHARQALAIVEAMKMQHIIAAPCAGRVRSITAAESTTITEGEVLLALIAETNDAGTQLLETEQDLDSIRADLAELQARQAKLLDASRPEAVERRRKTGSRTARENIADLCDPGSFQEYGGLVIAAQRSRRTLQELIDRTPADGMVMGLGRVNGDLFADRDARCIVMAYDYTVLAGTQGTKNHEKKDRLFELAARFRLPVIAFAEGGGGRPGDIDANFAASLHIKAFTLFAQLSGKVPLVSIVSGRCFAGNAALAGCCDVIIATENTSLGMGGPAMIEGGGLGVFHPDQVGPAAMQAANGVIDILVRDEPEAVRVAKQYLSYFQGPIATWECADQRRLRHVVPENRKRAYDVHAALELIADSGTLLELRPRFAPNAVTALIRVEGRPMGVIANNPMSLGGAIDANAADKMARFLQLCEAFGLPILSLCDTPGNMVGPEAEKTALVRHCCRLYVIGANLTVPFFSVVLRKAYGLGSQAMVGGSFHQPLFSVAWPTGEFGPMNLEGAVKLGYRKELEAIPDAGERARVFEKMVAEAYERGKAIATATLFEIDDVIDPAQTRTWVSAGLRSLPDETGQSSSRAKWVDAW